VIKEISLSLGKNQSPVKKLRGLDDPINQNQTNQTSTNNETSIRLGRY
jgi:hypothetical protein